jgi:hypothetical protein
MIGVRLEGNRVRWISYGIFTRLSEESREGGIKLPRVPLR